MGIKYLTTTFLNEQPRSIIGSLASSKDSWEKLGIDIADFCQIKKGQLISGPCVLGRPTKTFLPIFVHSLLKEQAAFFLLLSNFLQRRGSKRQFQTGTFRNYQQPGHSDAIIKLHM